MTIDPYRTHASRFDVAGWSDASARGALQLIAASVAQMVGFEVAVISAVQGDVFVSVAVEGGDDVRAAMSEMHTPLHNITSELMVAEDWGRFKYVPHDAIEPEDEFRWIPDIVQGDDPDSWHPLDALLAPLYTEDGELCGLLSIDLPLSRLRPDATQRSLLERYAAQAERALQNAFERDALAQRLRLAEAARHVVRVAVSQPDIEAALGECRPALLEGFRADDLTLRTYADDHGAANVTSPKPASDDLRSLLSHLSHRCWELQRVGVMHRDWHDRELLTDREYADTLAALVSLGYTSALLVPVGAGRRCLGHLILFRKDAEVTWTDDERAGALEVTRDIGHAVLASRNLVREQRLVTELRELDTYKTQLLATVSHELKNPLGAIVGHLELIAAAPDLSRDAEFSVGAMGRASARLARVVDDLLTLSKLEDPETSQPAETLDLRPVVDAALENTRFAAEGRDLVVRLEAPDAMVPVCGDRDGLERVFTNLIGNAVKYTPPGGAVTVTIRCHGDASSTGGAADQAPTREVEVAVSDEGIGISDADQERLFTEFFRSTNPEALTQPGTGLGLTISARIVDGHRGRIEVESELGVGSTFRVFLPVGTP